MNSLRDLFVSNNFAILDGSFYMIYPSETKCKKDFFKWYDSMFQIEKIDDLSFLDEVYMYNNSAQIKSHVELVGQDQYNRNLDSIVDSDFIKMFTDHVVPSFERPRKKATKAELSEVDISVESAKRILSKINTIVIDSNCYPLDRSRWVFDYYLSINSRKYSIGSFGIHTVDEIINQWDSDLQKTLQEKTEVIARRTDNVKGISNVGYFHDPGKGIGYLKQKNSYLVYATVPAFCLYEKKNKKNYAFSETKVGLKVKKDKKWSWENPIVIDRYSHPFLQHKDQEMQDICIGPYVAQLQRMRFALDQDQSLLPNQIVHVLEYSKNLLMKGYRPDKSSVLPWKRLHKDFSDYVPDNLIGTEPKYVPTNIGDDWI